MVAFVTGIICMVQYYVPHQVSINFMEWMSKNFVIVSAFAAILGYISLFMGHYGKIKRQADGWGFSVVMFLGILFALTTGVMSQGTQISPEGTGLTAFGWMYTFMLSPLQSTMFALLGFYVVSTSYRAFRVRSAQAFVLFIAAVILLFGRVPLGQQLWTSWMSWMPFTISELVEWVMDTPVVGARRGILLGVALGSVATSIKIIVGIERQYLGGD